MIRNLALIVGVTVVLVFAISLGLTKWQAIGLVTAAIATPIVWQVIRPLPFEFTHHAGEFKLMFLDPSLAREVAILNHGELEDDDENGRETGTEQPATLSEMKSEGGDRPQPESEGRSR